MDAPCVLVSERPSRPEDEARSANPSRVATMATFRYAIVDVFTDTPLEGNQLAVFTDARRIPEDMLQALAREMKFSESTFVLPPEQGGALRPDLGRLAGLPGALGVNCFAGSGTRWKTRMFAPSGGVDEDPATGSAAGPLALHLARHGRIEFGTEIVISQGAEIQRPSTLYARVDGTAAAVERIEVGGSAVVVARGEFRI